MIVCRVAASLLAGGLCVLAQQKDPPPDFRELLQRVAAYKPEPCGLPYEEPWDASEFETPLFQHAADLATEQINVANATSPHESAAAALKKLEAMSASTNASWPDERRFHFEVIDLAPALVVKLSIRTHAAFFFFGVPTRDSWGKPN